MLITLYTIGEVHFRLLGTIGFHVKAKNERYTAASSCCRQNLKYEYFTSSFGRLRQTLHLKACCTCRTNIFLHSTNQIIDLWSCRWRCRRQTLNSLLKSLSKDDGTRKQWSDWLNWITKSNRVARATRTSVEFIDVVCQMTTWTNNSKSFILSFQYYGAPTSHL